MTTPTEDYNDYFRRTYNVDPENPNKLQRPSAAKWQRDAGRLNPLDHRPQLPGENTALYMGRMAAEGWRATTPFLQAGFWCIVILPVIGFNLFLWGMLFMVMGHGWHP